MENDVKFQCASFNEFGPTVQRTDTTEANVLVAARNSLSIQVFKIEFKYRILKNGGHLWTGSSAAQGLGQNY